MLTKEHTMAARHNTISKYCRVMSILMERLQHGPIEDRTAFTKQHKVTANFFNMLERAGYIEQKGPIMQWTGPSWPERQHGEAVADAERQLREEANRRKQLAQNAEPQVADQPAPAKSDDTAALDQSMAELTRELTALKRRVQVVELRLHQSLGAHQRPLFNGDRSGETA